MLALCRCCLIHSMDASNKPKVGQNGENTSVQEQPTHKRVPKTCSKCGKSVVNLSRHQKDVHGMKKLKRKLGDYFMGMKKKPKGTVKFCPLSPCKGNRTPIFQLHKHLQTSLHGLRPNTPSYIKALIKDVRAHCYCASLVRTLFIGHARATSLGNVSTDDGDAMGDA